VTAPPTPATSTIAVLGLGYVGCVTAACFASLGHRVIGVDPDEHKVRSVLDGRSPFYEPGLDDLVASNQAAGRISATTSLADALKAADVAFLCVGTPSAKNGDMSMEYLEKVSSDIAKLMQGRTTRLIVVVRSTVFPGTCEDLATRILGGNPLTPVLDNPEFLREGAAVRDFLEPALIVVGGSDQSAVDYVAGLYAPLAVEVSKVSIRTAEMIKYSCNAFHAVKIGFANEMGALCDSMGVPKHEVMTTMCRDTKLNISTVYMRPGFAFGGSCLPKDLRAITFRANRLDVSLPMLSSVIPSNDAHLDRSIQSVMDLPAKRIGIFGLAFKENTDDLRESPVVRLVEYLIGKGKDLRIYDPHIQIDQLYGSNKNFILNSVPHIGRLMQKSLADLVESSDHLVVAQNPNHASAAQLRGSRLPLLDLTGSMV
jgi:GDP-mannose 6-dehydrogenase